MTKNRIPVWGECENKPEEKQKNGPVLQLVLEGHRLTCRAFCPVPVLMLLGSCRGTVEEGHQEGQRAQGRGPVAGWL